MAKKGNFSSGPTDNPFAAALQHALGGYTPIGEDSSREEGKEEVETDASGLWVHLWIEKKGRAGKTATLLEFQSGTDADIVRWGSLLKTHCGVGGSVHGAEVLLQGDVRSKAEAWLRAQQFKVKRTGG